MKLLHTSTYLLDKICSAAGPQFLEYYFHKGALLGQKAAINLCYVDTI